MTSLSSRLRLNTISEFIILMIDGYRYCCLKSSLDINVGGPLAI